MLVAAAVFEAYKGMMNHFGFAFFLRFSANSAANGFGGAESTEIMEMLREVHS